MSVHIDRKIRADLGDFDASPRRRDGWGGRIRTCEYRHQKPVTYRLSTPQDRITALAQADAITTYRHQQEPDPAVTG